MDDDSRYGNDAADGQTSRIAHEYLGWISIVPEETDQTAHEGQ